jgi:hypothetical protein
VCTYNRDLHGKEGWILRETPSLMDDHEHETLSERSMSPMAITIAITYFMMLRRQRLPQSPSN